MELRYVCSEYLVLWRTETFCNDSNGRTSYADQRGGYRFLVFFKKNLCPGAPYGLAIMDEKNQELLDMFNKGLEDIKANGTYDEIIAKYLGE